MINSHLLEVLAVSCCLVNIYLITRANVLNWLFGVVTVSLYFVIFLKAKLYADMSLQVVFLGLQFYGWYRWLFGSETHSTLAIRKAPPLYFAVSFVLAAVLFFLISFILTNYTDSTTIYQDAFITALSLAAQWLLSQKWLQHWLLWMVVDIVSIKVYLLKHLYFTSGLYAILLMLCIYGYYNWRKQFHAISRVSLASA